MAAVMLTLCVHDRGYCDGQTELHEQPAQTAGSRSEPACQRTGTGRQLGASSRTPSEVSGNQALLAVAPTSGSSVSQSGGGGTRSDRTVRTRLAISSELATIVLMASLNSAISTRTSARVMTSTAIPRRLPACCCTRSVNGYVAMTKVMALTAGRNGCITQSWPQWRYR